MAVLKIRDASGNLIDIPTIKGADGRGIVSVNRTAGNGAPGTTDTYTITYTDNTTSIFYIYNGVDGVGIVSIDKTSTQGLTDIYTIGLSDNSSHTFTVHNGMSGITLPIVNITGDYLTDWVGKEEREAFLEYNSKELDFKAHILMKPQGTSSLVYPKKNFNIKMYSDHDFTTKYNVSIKSNWGPHNKYTLKADYIDKTHACNVVSAQIAGEMGDKYDILPDAPNHGLIEGFPVIVYFNGDYQGIYNWNIPKDGWMLGFDDEENNLILCAEVHAGVGSFRESLISFGDTSWSLEYGGEDEEAAITSFNRLITFIKDSSDADFRTNFSDYLDLDSALNYYCFCYLSAAIDNLGKNMLMVTNDRLVWHPVLYDLDSLWGVSYDGTTAIAADYKCPDDYECSTSLLWEKLVRCFPNELATRYFDLRKDVLSQGNIIGAFREYIAQIPKWEYADEVTLWTGMADMIRSMEQISTWLPKRIRYVDYMFRQMFTVTDEDYGRCLYDLPETFIGDGISAVINTGVALYNNVDRDWTVIMRAPNVPKTAGFGYFVAALTDGGFGIQASSEVDSSAIVHFGYNSYVETYPSEDEHDYFTIAVVKQGINYTIYRDGVQVGDVVVSDLQIPNLIPLRIGANGSQSDTWQYSNVTVNNLRIYRKALGKADIQGIITEMLS